MINKKIIPEDVCIYWCAVSIELSHALNLCHYLTNMTRTNQRLSTCKMCIGLTCTFPT